MVATSGTTVFGRRWGRAALCGALGLAALSLAACGELEPMNEPEVTDLQLTIDTLKTQIRDAQRTMTELRTELEARRQELAEAHVMKAQLEGRVREAERRVVEARHVIDLQREELAAARSERQRMSKSSLQLQDQLKQLQKHAARSRLFPDSGQSVTPAAHTGSGVRIQKAAPAPLAVESSALLGMPSPETPAGERQVKGVAVRAISVRPGDTLYSIAKAHRIRLERLRSLNGLTDNLIEVGQTIWVPADRAGGSAVSRNAATTP